jgi:hypothetical protein
MFPDIYIPTCRPIEKQHTYNLLPKFLKKKVIFLLRDPTGFEHLNYIISPARSAYTAFEHVKQIAEERGVPYWQMDDDMTALTRRLHLWGNATRKQIEARHTSNVFPILWETRFCTLQDWKDLVKTTQQMTKTHELVSFANRGTIACPWRYPCAEGLVGRTVWCFSGRPLDASWLTIPTPYADVDFAFQVITAGHRVARFESYCITTLPSGMHGLTKRDHLASRTALIKRWRPYVKAKDTRKGRNDTRVTLPAQIIKYLMRYSRDVAKGTVRLRNKHV